MFTFNKQQWDIISKSIDEVYLSMNKSNITKEQKEQYLKKRALSQHKKKKNKKK